MSVKDKKKKASVKTAVASSAAAAANHGGADLTSLQSRIDELERKELETKGDEAWIAEQVERESAHAMAEADKASSAAAVLRARYLAALTESKRLERELKRKEKGADATASQLETALGELGRQKLMNARLQELCRTLQYESKAAKAESAAKQLEYAEKAESYRADFQGKLDEIKSNIDKQQSADQLLQAFQAENEALKAQMQELVSRFKETQTYSEKVAEAHGLEKQLWEKKLAMSDEQRAQLEALVEQASKKLAQYDRDRVAWGEVADRSREVVEEYKVQLTNLSKQSKKADDLHGQLKQQFAVEQYRLTETVKTLTAENASLKAKVDKLSSLVRAVQARAGASSAGGDEGSGAGAADAVTVADSSVGAGESAVDADGK